MNFKYNFKFGKQETKLHEYAIIGFAFSILVPFLSTLLRSDEDSIIDFIDETQKIWWPNGKINDYIINHPQLLDRRITREVDSSIDEYNDLTGNTTDVILEEPVFTETLEGETALGGTLQLSSPWMTDPDPNQQTNEL